VGLEGERAGVAGRRPPWSAVPTPVMAGQLARHLLHRLRAVFVDRLSGVDRESGLSHANAVDARTRDDYSSIFCSLSAYGSGVFVSAARAVARNPVRMPSKATERAAATTDVLCPPLYKVLARVASRQARQAPTTPTACTVFRSRNMYPESNSAVRKSPLDFLDRALLIASINR